MVEQGSVEWHMMRLGKATASRISDIMAKGKSGPSASRKNYATQLVVERLTTNFVPGYESPAMAAGKIMEAAARGAYEYLHGCTVELVDFVNHPTLPMSGASPDGLVGDVGLVQFKCPQPTQHLDTYLGAAIDRSYLLQMQWELACTGRGWCDFASYNETFPEDMRLVVIRVPRDPLVIVEVTAAVRDFLAEVDSRLAQALERRELLRQEAA